MKHLHNIHSKQVLEERLNSETYSRRTVSFYRYVKIDDPATLRDQLFSSWSALNCLGRIYIAREGINAQMSVPEPVIDRFLVEVGNTPGLQDMPMKWAVEDMSRSFLKLVVKVRNRIVADGLEDDVYDVTNVGRHLTAREFHRLSDDKDTVIVDMRNDYEFEIGHFKGALNLKTDTFREAMQEAVIRLGDKRDKKILLYCTGGIRCEKASAWLKHNGFEDVNQLHGGIIEYARYVQSKQLPSHFTGKNFVFDERMGESIDGCVISTCQQCGKPCDDYTNCANDHCHVLFIQCSECAKKHEGCCSQHCNEILHMPEEEKSRHTREYLSNDLHQAFNNSRIRRRNFERNSCSV